MHHPPDQFLMPCAVHCTAYLLPPLRLVAFESYLCCAFSTMLVKAASDNMQLKVQGHLHVGTCQVCQLYKQGHSLCNWLGETPTAQSWELRISYAVSSGAHIGLETISMLSHLVLTEERS